MAHGRPSRARPRPPDALAVRSLCPGISRLALAGRCRPTSRSPMTADGCCVGRHHDRPCRAAAPTGRCTSRSEALAHPEQVVMRTIGADDPLAVAAIEAIHAGDVEVLRRLLAEHPELASARVESEECQDEPGAARSLLHVVTDWPGHFPSGAAMVAVLVEAGADPNARFAGPHTETPLHWAASS